MKLNTETFRLEDAGSFGKKALMAGIVGLLISVAGYFVNADQFWRSYLTAFTFWTSIGLGGMFFVLVKHLAGAEWSVVLRRLAENFMITLPIMFVFFLPILFGSHHLYEWTHTEVVAKDPILSAKSGYLNMTFFTIRTVLYFAIWTIFGRMLYKMSIGQDGGDQSKNNRMRQLSAPGMILFAFSITYASFDWIMSLQPHWFSTIFGVWYFAGSLLNFLAMLVLIAIYLRKRGVLDNVISIDHFHDLGKLQFAFTIFWAYIAFSQFFLIWYANVPEETIFFLKRWEGSWMYVSIGLLVCHLMIPFILLIPRANKRNLAIMKFVAIWFLFMHWVDLYWNIFPTWHDAHHGVVMSGLWVDAATILGIGGIFLWYFWMLLGKQALAAHKDPSFEKSMHHVNL